MHPHPRNLAGRTVGLAMLLAHVMFSQTALAQAPAPAEGSPAPDYTVADHWICHPAHSGLCKNGLDVTEIDAQGRITVRPWQAAAQPKVDCFYLYPMVSNDPGQNSDLQWSMDEEGGVTHAQAARFGSACRVYAPLYRQYTLSSAWRGLSKLSTQPDAAAVEVAYGDVLRAWKHYLAHENQGRGVVLIGHSEGSMMLARLVKEAFDQAPEQRAGLVAAYLIGTTIQVPKGQDVGADYQHVPLCRSATQTGCIVSYNSYRASQIPWPLGMMGRNAGKGKVAACNSPAALLGEGTWLSPVFPSSTTAKPGDLTRPPKGPWVDPAYGTVTTPYVSLPRYMTGECVSRWGYNYLAVKVAKAAGDPRVSDPGGDVNIPLVGALIAYHNVDYYLQMNDLVRLIGMQADSFVQSRP